MKQSIYISDQGELLLIDAPEKPQRCKTKCHDACQCDVEASAYSGILASAIAKGVKISKVYGHLPFITGDMKEWRDNNIGKVFDLPTGYKVSFEDDCQRFKNPTHLGGGVKCSEGCYFKGGGLKVCEKLAILSKLEEEVVVAPSEEVKQERKKIELGEIFEVDSKCYMFTNPTTASQRPNTDHGHILHEIDFLE